MCVCACVWCMRLSPEIRAQAGQDSAHSCCSSLPQRDAGRWGWIQAGLLSWGKLMQHPLEILVCLLWGHTWQCSRGYSWFDTQESLLEVLLGTYCIQGIKPKAAVCKASIPPAVSPASSLEVLFVFILCPWSSDAVREQDLETLSCFLLVK